jgi:RNA polymerase sigma factor (sigma-70 family)
LVRALVLAGAPLPLAEDLAQDAFARMFTHWWRVRTGSSPAGYAYRSAFRLLSRSRRMPKAAHDATGWGEQGTPAVTAPLTLTSAQGQTSTLSERSSEPNAAAATGPEGLVATRMAVASTLAAMAPRRRECAVMCLVVGLSTREVASALGIAEGTVRKHLAEARDDLHHALEQ